MFFLRGLEIRPAPNALTKIEKSKFTNKISNQIESFESHGTQRQNKIIYQSIKKNMLSFGEFSRRYSALRRGQSTKQTAAKKYTLARHAMLRFGSTLSGFDAALRDVVSRVMADPSSTRDAFDPSKPSTDIKIFATGPLRAMWFRNPSADIFRQIEVTLIEYKMSTGYNVSLTYLPFAEEAMYGFMTMVNDPQTPEKIRAVLEKAHLPTHSKIIVVQSGTTTCQPAVYDLTTNTFENANLFEYGAKNQDPEEFGKLVAWLRGQAPTVVLDAGAHGYAVPTGVVATSPGQLLPAEGKTKEAVDSAQRLMSACAHIEKTYVLPQRKMCELKTSPADSMRVVHPYSHILDWGGGQIQEPTLGIKSSGFEQRSLL
jgi:hypothetical protein